MRDDLQMFMAEWLPPLEAEMRAVLSGSEQATQPHYGMMQYHMGWVDECFAPSDLPAGKRLRPILCLLACAEVGGRTHAALPAAAAIEILHNFSLVHDDIEDGDETRRHRATVWKLWGVPPIAVLAALDVFTRMCVALTEGQYLDMSFERRDLVGIDEYLRMIGGKTAALVGASIAIGAHIGGAAPQQAEALQRFGREVGLAFQIQDDVLGIWGDPAVTGKAAGNDVLRKKKSLPILHALNHPQVGARFAELLEAEMTPLRLHGALQLLQEAGSQAYAAAAAQAHFATAMAALDEGLGNQAQASRLRAVAEWLLQRNA